MRNAELPKIHRPSDVRFVATVEDVDGVPVSWYALSHIRALLVPDYLRGQTHSCEPMEISEDGYTLTFNYAAHYPQYLGVSRVILSAELSGRSVIVGVAALEFISELDGMDRRTGHDVSLSFVLSKDRLR